MDDGKNKGGPGGLIAPDGAEWTPEGLRRKASSAPAPMTSPLFVPPPVTAPPLPDVCPLCPVSRLRRRDAPSFKPPINDHSRSPGWVCPVCGRGVASAIAPQGLSMYLQPELTSIVDYTMQDGIVMEKETAPCALDYCYNLADTFVAAHRDRPGGLSLELGTFEGTGARILLRLLDAVYGGKGRLQDLPWLVTCDPYGNKPYLAGRTGQSPSDALICEEGMYGEESYQKAKEALAPWSNHAHYPVRSFDLLPLLGQMWPFPQTARLLTFALLDAEHVVGAVLTEATLVFALDPQAVVVVDNCCNDPLIIPELKKRWRVETIHESACVTKWGMPCPNLTVKVTAKR